MQLLALLWIAICIFVSHTYSTLHLLIFTKICTIKLIEVHKMPVCSHSSIDTHTDYDSVENRYINYFV